MKKPELLTEALKFCAHGLPALPVDEKKGPLCKYGHWGEQSQTETELRALPWDQAHGLAVLTWPASNLVVLDFDGPHADELWHEQTGIVLPETAINLTGGGGTHRIYTMPSEWQGVIQRKIKLVRETESCGEYRDKRTGEGKICGVDVLVKGYFIVPPTPGYREDPDHPFEPNRLAILPQTVLDLIRSTDSLTISGGLIAVPDSGWVQQAMQGPVHEGRRNDTATRLAGLLLRRGLTPDETLAVLTPWAQITCIPPMDERELRTVVASIAKREQTGVADIPEWGTATNSILPYKGRNGKETNFSPVVAADLLVQKSEPMHWIWTPFLPKGGLVLLASFMKIGKSTFVSPLAIAIAQGRRFLGYPTEQGGVLILAVEEHPRDVHRRLRRFGLRREDPVYVHADRLEDCPATFQAVRNFIRAKNIKAVLLDTLPRFWTVEDENDNAQVKRAAVPFLDLARDTGAVVVLLHHERKAGGEDGRGIRGGSALFGLVDQALTLERRHGGRATHRVLRAYGRYEETPPALVLELAGDEFRKVGTLEEMDAVANEAKIMDALTDVGQDVISLAEKTGIDQGVVRKTLNDLGNKVIREGQGVKGDPYTYRMVPANSFLLQPDSR